MVSVSVSELRVTVVENGDAVVVFDAMALGGAGADNDFLERSVEVTFKAAQWVRTAPAATNECAIPPDLFDRSAVEPGPDDDPGEYLDAARRRWIASGICPDPNFYEVAESRWLAESGAAKLRCKHYVLEGHGMWIEVLCRSMAWRWVEPAASAALVPSTRGRRLDS
jgi:hypothetical protein